MKRIIIVAMVLGIMACGKLSDGDSSLNTGEFPAPPPLDNGSINKSQKVQCNLSKISKGSTESSNFYDEGEFNIDLQEKLAESDNSYTASVDFEDDRLSELISSFSHIQVTVWPFVEQKGYPLALSIKGAGTETSVTTALYPNTGSSPIGIILKPFETLQLFASVGDLTYRWWCTVTPIEDN